MTIYNVLFTSWSMYKVIRRANTKSSNTVTWMALRERMKPWGTSRSFKRLFTRSRSSFSSIRRPLALAALAGSARDQAQRNCARSLLFGFQWIENTMIEPEDIQGACAQRLPRPITAAPPKAYTPRVRLSAWCHTVCHSHPAMQY